MPCTMPPVAAIRSGSVTEITISRPSEAFGSRFKISEVQKAVNEIFGSDKYQISGGIENNCTESGYYVMPGGRGGDAVLALKDYSISNSRINESGASVSVSENWQEVGSDGVCRDVSVKTTYIIGYEKGFLYLENVIFD